MGLKGLMSAMGMNFFAQAGLLLSFASFVAVLWWTWSQPDREMERCARLPIDDELGSEKEGESMQGEG